MSQPTRILRHAASQPSPRRSRLGAASGRNRSGRLAVAGLAALLGLGLVGCGGGGGGGGGGSGGGGIPGPDDSVQFTGFTFKLGDGLPFTEPPLEDLGSTPTQLGAPLNLTVIFNFDGIPEGPYTSSTLPVFTTPAEVTEEAGATGINPVILAKGTYVLVDRSVEFRPFVPTQPLQVNLAAPAAAVPGLLPASVYTARINTTGSQVLGNLDTNLHGVPGSVKFGTTSNAAAYFPNGTDDALPPEVLVVVPADGSGQFYPGTFSATALGATTPTFPPGPDSFQLTYDRALLPTEANLLGSDLDQDGVVDPNFFLRARSTRLLVGQEVPADTFGVHPPFAAVSGLLPGTAAALDGEDVVLHADGSGSLPAPDAGLVAPAKSLAADREASLLWMVLGVDGGPDLLTVTDHLLGDPAYAQMATDGRASPAPAALDTGLDDLVGLTTLVDGRLVAYDRTTRRIYELLPTVVRQLPSLADGQAHEPVLLGLGIGDGTTGFRSAVQPASAGEIVDLASAADGTLYALAVRAGDPAAPSLLRLQPIDADLDGQFTGSDGLFSGAQADVLLELGETYVDVQPLPDGSLLALNRQRDTIDRLDLLTGVRTTYVPDVAALGHGLPSLPEGLSPATCFAFGESDFDVQVELLANADTGAVVRLRPRGVLPPGTEISVMQRFLLTSLFGGNDLNVAPEAGLALLGGRRLMGVTTALPSAGPSEPIDDVFAEDFSDHTFEDGTPSTVSPLAEWASAVQGGVQQLGLRASVGVSESAQLGDFLPQANPNFLPNQSYLRGAANQGEIDLDTTRGNFAEILLDTNVQAFPLPSGATPGITEPISVTGGRFSFRDFIIPEGVIVKARGNNPLVITATRRLEIHGLIDARGGNGLGDDSFDTGFLPVPGGPGGPGAGRGGDSHPTLFDPFGPGSIDQYVTPETGEPGYGPIVTASGQLLMQPIGGGGGISTAGYDPNPNAAAPCPLPRMPGTLDANNEHHRPPGGGGGSFYALGDQAHNGSGVFRVQSNSTWFPFTQCPTNDKVHDMQYGNGENFFCTGNNPTTPLQCVYMTYKPGFDGDCKQVDRFKPGGLPGDAVFVDDDPDNDFFGQGGEHAVLFGGQGGGGGGSRVDSIRHGLWSLDAFGSPEVPPVAPPCYPKLQIGSVFVSPTFLDSKGGGGGGGGGAVMLRSFGDIVIGRTGYIDTSGGHGGGGEVVTNSSFSGGGGGGSGGAIILQAAGSIRILGDANHKSAGYIDASGAMGAALDVSGGMGRDARTSPSDAPFNFVLFTREVTRSDGGQGGTGLIQLQTGDGTGMPSIQQGAFLFSRRRAVLKLGPWTGPDDAGKQAEHISFQGQNTGLPDELRYIDMLHYRTFTPEVTTSVDSFYVLNGSYPPLTPSTAGVNGSSRVLVNEYPPGSGQTWFDTKMIELPQFPGRQFVQEPEPQKVMKTYNGWDASFQEINNPPNDPFFPNAPGTTYAGEVIPMSWDLVEPDGTPFMIEQDGATTFDPRHLVERLPVVHPSKTPPPFGTLSQGTSSWLDFNGVALRTRDLAGRTPPFFAAFHGTYNAAEGLVPTGLDGQVKVGAHVVNKPARIVQATGFVDPGLFGNGPDQGDPPFNDVAVDAPDTQLLLQDAVSDNATVTVLFQGAYPVRSGSSVPDEESLTAWVTDLSQLTGFPLVRFRVVFDLGADTENLPFGVDSFRPRVRYLRMRATY